MSPGRHFLWEQGHLALELNGALTARIGEYAYLPGTERPLAFITNSITGQGVRVIYQDAQGSVMGLVGTDGALLASQKSSDPWGVTSTWPLNLVMPDTMRLGWQGLMAERAPVNLYYARARWYDPLTKRFLSPDPLGVAAGVNRYVFAGGDPMNMDDAFGLDKCSNDAELSGNYESVYVEGSGWWCRPLSLSLPGVVIEARAGTPIPGVRSSPSWGDLGNFTAGLVDNLLLGLGDEARDALGVALPIDRCSTAYRVGSYTALAVGVGRLAYAGIASGASLAAASGRSASAVRNGLKVAFRGGLFPSFRRISYEELLAKYEGSDELVRAAAGRTNPGWNAFGLSAFVGALTNAADCQ